MTVGMIEYYLQEKYNYMGLLPDIEDGKLVETQKQPTPYTPPRTHHLLKEEERLSELNNLGRKPVTEDFSDSKFADRV